MLSSTQQKAVTLMFEMPEDRVAKELGIQLSALRQWKEMKEFRDELDARAREARESAARIIVRVLELAAVMLLLAVTPNTEGGAVKVEFKALLDLFKAAGLLEATLEEAPSSTSQFDQFMGRVLQIPGAASGV